MVRDDLPHLCECSHLESALRLGGCFHGSQGIIDFIKLIIPRLSKPFGLCSLLFAECPRDEDSMVVGREGCPGARKAGGGISSMGVEFVT